MAGIWGKRKTEKGSDVGLNVISGELQEDIEQDMTLDMYLQ